MKLDELIKKLEQIKRDIKSVGGNPSESQVVMFEKSLDGYTTDIEVSVDDENNVEVYVVGGAKPF